MMYSLGFFKPVCILPKRPKVPILASCVPRLTEMGKGHLRGSRRSKQARLVERRYGYPGPRPQWNTLPFAMRRSILRRREREAQARRRAGRAGRAAAQHDAQLALATGNAAAASGATPSTGQDFSAAPGGDTANKNNGPCDGGGGGGDGGGDHVASVSAGADAPSNTQADAQVEAQVDAYQALIDWCNGRTWQMVAI